MKKRPSDVPSTLKCLRPVVVRSASNPDVKISVPCGHCDACRLRKASTHSLLIQQEALSHMFCCVVLLTYDDDHVPYQCFNYDESLRTLTLFDSETGEITSEKTIDKSRLLLYSKHIRYVQKQTIDGPRYAVPTLSKKDIQLFFKRFRRNLQRSLEKRGISECQQIRYFVCGEYGPRTHRPHYHALFFFDKLEIYWEFRNVLRASWKLGFANFSLSKGHAANYVSTYVAGSSFDSNPYEDCTSKPFALHSIRLGEENAVRNFINDPFPDFAAVSKFGFNSNGTFVECLPPRSYISSLYPKCYRYGDLFLSERIKAYLFARFCNRFSYTRGFDTLKCLRRSKQLLAKWYCEYLDLPSLDVLSSCDPSCPNDQEFLKKYINRVENAYRTSRRVIQNACACYPRAFSIADAVSCYVRRIDGFYSSLEYTKLVSSYEEQQSFIDRFGLERFNSDIKSYFYPIDLHNRSLGNFIYLQFQAYIDSNVHACIAKKSHNKKTS